jgi:membrane protein implicated in regulation of membrane protease activity
MPWWLWIVGGLVIGMLELMLPGYIFLGFAIGAVLVGGALWLGFAPALAAQLAIWAVISLAAWLGLRALLPYQRGEVKRWRRDIND